MVTRRWCLSCFEDFAEDISEAGLCMACDYEHDRAVALGRLPFGVRNHTVTRWWGPTLYDIVSTDDSGDADGWHAPKGNLNARGTALMESGLRTDDPYQSAWRACHSCGELFQETEWPSVPRCDVCESGLTWQET